MVIVFGCQQGEDGHVNPRVDTGDLIDAQSVAELLGLAQRTSVSVYQRRYRDMPRPVVDLGAGRPRLWLRSEVQAWAKARRRNR
jgi:glutathione-regulated potassium-efflux system ancillary protein KefG